MLLTTQELYYAFLDGIRNYKTDTVPPDRFNRLINDAQDIWIRENIPFTDLTQENIDKLEAIHVITDGVCVHEGITLYPITPESAGNPSVFTLPLDPDADIPNDQETTQNYPRYIRALGVSFKINYGDDDNCEQSGISDWLELDLIRSDARTAEEHNHYKKATNRRIKYDIKGGLIYLYTGGATGHSFRLEYLRYPRKIWYDDDEFVAGRDHGTFTPAVDVDPYVNGYGSINCEIHPLYRRDIVAIAVRTYLEGSGDPRYQSYLAEQSLRQNNQTVK